MYHAVYCLHIIYMYILGIIHWYKIIAIFAVTFQQRILQRHIFILHRNLSQNIPNSEIITTQLGPDT